MKKIAILLAFSFVFCGASISLSATTFIHNGDPDGDLTETSSAMLWAYRTSTNVILVAETTVANDAYAVAAGHTQGNRIYSSSSGNAQITVGSEIVKDELPITETMIKTIVTGIDPEETDPEPET